MAPHILMIQRTTLHCSDHAYCFRTLEFLCEEASAHRPAPLERLEQLCSDLLFERQEARLRLGRSLLPVAGGLKPALATEQHCQAFFYRSAGGAEMDLVIDHPGGERWAIEVKRSLTPALSRGFHQARVDLDPQHCFVVIPREGRFPLAPGVEALGLAELAGWQPLSCPPDRVTIA